MIKYIKTVAVYVSDQPAACVFYTEKLGLEVRRRESPDALVPIDRDPVPPQYAEGVRRYYERLGSGR